MLLLALLLALLVPLAASQASPPPSATPTAALPVDSTADFTCSQPVRGSLFWGKYNAAGIWSLFSSCDTGNAFATPTTGIQTWYEPSQSGSYCQLRSGGGHTNAPTACSGC